MCFVKLNDVRRIAMSLPEVTEEPHFASASFRVRGKIFATVPPDGEYLHIFVAEEDREPALVMAPGVIEKLWWGGKVRGLRVALQSQNAPGCRAAEESMVAQGTQGPELTVAGAHERL